MADIKTAEARSYNMSRIRSFGTKPEEKVRKYLFSKGYRYRKNDKRYPGKPDIVLPKYKTVVFINGCFWHRHENCKIASTPKDNADFWQKKFDANVMRDQRNENQLRADGWNVIVVWECEVKTKKAFDERMNLLEKEITGDCAQNEEERQ